MNATQRGIAALLRSGITGEKLVMPEGFALEEALELLGRHSVAPLAYQGAQHCGFAQSEEAMQKLLRVYFGALKRSEMQLRVLEKLFAAFEENGIPFMPVKGCNMKKLYPLPELRLMGDADILIHPEDHERIRLLMEQIGFEFVLENEHVFEWRTEYLMVELHKSLVPPKDEDYYAYYGTGWRLAKGTETSRFVLSAEDAYIFMFTHFARHYRYGGIGCRHVVDLFVYRRKFTDMDETYIAGELEKLGLTKFHENTLRMLECWFGERESDEVTDLMTDFIYSSGNWGTYQTHLYLREVKQVKKRGSVGHSRVHVWVRTLFPPYSTMTGIHPWLKKCPILLPVSWFVRAVRIPFTQRDKMSRKIGALNRISDEGVHSHRSALEKVGLDFGSVQE